MSIDFALNLKEFNSVYHDVEKLFFDIYPSFSPQLPPSLLSICSEEDCRSILTVSLNEIQMNPEKTFTISLGYPGNSIPYDATLCFDFWHQECPSIPSMRSRIGTGNCMLRDLHNREKCEVELLYHPLTKFVGNLLLKLDQSNQLPKALAPTTTPFDPSHLSSMTNQWMQNVLYKSLLALEKLYKPAIPLIRRVYLSKVWNRSSEIPGPSFFIMPSRVVIDEDLLMSWLTIFKQTVRGRRLLSPGCVQFPSFEAYVAFVTAHVQSLRYRPDQYGSEETNPEEVEPVESFDDLGICGLGDCEDSAKLILRIHHAICNTRFVSKEMKQFQMVGRQLVAGACLCTAYASSAPAGGKLNGENEKNDPTQSHMTTLFIHKQRFERMQSSGTGANLTFHDEPILIGEGTGRIEPDWNHPEPPKLPFSVSSPALSIYDTPRGIHFYSHAVHFFTVDNQWFTFCNQKNQTFGVHFRDLLQNRYHHPVYLYKHEPLSKELLGLVEQSMQYEYPRSRDLSLGRMSSNLLKRRDGIIRMIRGFRGVSSKGLETAEMTNLYLDLTYDNINLREVIPYVTGDVTKEFGNTLCLEIAYSSL